ncbi:hypothetical protein [Rhodococcus jostii]|nr:hypothetical protein [Rhodococcus jostii]
MKPETAEARMLLSVIEHAQNMVALADYDTGRLRYLNPAGMQLRNAADGTDRRGRRRRPLGVVGGCLPRLSIWSIGCLAPTHAGGFSHQSLP